MTLDHKRDQPLQTLLRDFTSNAETVSQPKTESWNQMIERILVPGRINEISESIYEYFLEVLPPKWHQRSCFGFADGDEPLRLFWKQGNRFHCRQLTSGESQQLCDFSGLARDYQSS